MTAAPAEAAPLYAALGALYESELNAYGTNAAMLIHKWRRDDLVAPHSDLDIRVVLMRAPEDWQEWNGRLAAAHTAAVIRDIANRRLLEHPPGFAFTVSEVDRRRVSPPELATWSLLRGDARALRHWKGHARTSPWSHQDENFYRGILASRLGGRYQLSADSTDNVYLDLSGYRRHCVVWHYLAPCWFAAAALATRTRFPGKSAALTQWRPNGLERQAEMFLRHARATEPDDARRTVAAQNLLSTAHATLRAAMRQVPTPIISTGPGEAGSSSATSWTMTAAMLRVRVARWLYYLDPPPGTATGYLITREAKELRAAAEVLRALAGDEATAAQRLAARMAALLPPGPTTAEVLRDTLAAWQRHRTVVQDFLTLHAT
ncbi:hypothetical protein [Planomonospora sp. ID82291]|uniref:hypothetical protein n=1 Tax=Planomonospora sp. ID82291 TaxID=2738136 RepID=UPI0018C3DE21|nr:hypothetical protein [Planomonospora sp. ID82291]MBG0818682.1 hypothetical protein [Planomonospora sp. ID82291]